MAEFKVEGADIEDVISIKKATNTEQASKIFRLVCEAFARNEEIFAPADVISALAFIASSVGAGAHARPEAMMLLLFDSMHGAGFSVHAISRGAEEADRLGHARRPAPTHPRVQRTMRPNGRHRGN